MKLKSILQVIVAGAFLLGCSEDSERITDKTQSGWPETFAQITTDKPSLMEVEAIAQEAFVYGLAMVLNYKTLYTYAVDKKSPDYKAPFNKLACEARVYTPDDKAIVTPNSDTPYCFIWHDLRKEPQILTVPKIRPDRYYAFQLVDLYTHNFGYIGTLTTGNQAGRYLLAGPNWRGTIPAGVNKIFRSETNFTISLVRTQLMGPGDLPQVKAIQGAYRLQTLSQYKGKSTNHPQSLPAFPKWVEGAQFDERFFAYFDFMLSLVEPVDEEREVMARFAKIGLGTPGRFIMSHHPLSFQDAMAKGLQGGLEEISQFAAKHGSDPNVTAKVFGTRPFLEASAVKNFGHQTPYVIRSAAAHLGIYGNSAAEAVYPGYYNDAKGVPLNGASNRYTLTLEARRLPPVKSFWSLTMYDGQSQLLVRNPLDRYLINSAMTDHFVRDKDGTITLYIQKDSPGKELEPNWLPAPDGPFYAVMRLYGPQPRAVNGQWLPPKMHRVE